MKFFIIAALLVAAVSNFLRQFWIVNKMLWRTKFNSFFCFHHPGFSWICLENQGRLDACPQRVRRRARRLIDSRRWIPETRLHPRRRHSLLHSLHLQAPWTLRRRQGLPHRRIHHPGWTWRHNPHWSHRLHRQHWNWRVHVGLPWIHVLLQGRILARRLLKSLTNVSLSAFWHFLFWYKFFGLQ